MWENPLQKPKRKSPQDFIGFYKNFQEAFGIKNYRTYVTGESYAGRYAPYIAAAMLNEKNKEYFNLKGMICPMFRQNTMIGRLICLRYYVD